MLDQVECTTGPFQRCQGIVDVLGGVIGRDGKSNTAGSSGYRRWTNSGGIDTVTQQGMSQANGTVGITHEDRQDWTFRRRELKAKALEPLCEVIAIAPQSGTPLGFLFHDTDRGGGCGGGGGPGGGDSCSGRHAGGG